MTTDAAPSRFLTYPAALRRHQSTLLVFFTSEAASQLLNIVSGIITVQGLTKFDLALFTLAAAFQVTVTLLADSGVGSAIIAVGGQRCDNPTALNTLIKTALRFRRSVAALVGSVAVPLLMLTAMHYGVSTAAAAGLGLWLIVTVGFQIENGVHSTVPRLFGRVKQYQLSNFTFAIVRLSGLLVLARMHELNIWSALAVNVGALILHTILLRRISLGILGTSGEFSDADYRTLRSYALSQAPNAIFYCLEGQLMIWLIATFGSAGGVAEVGALSRVAVAFSIVMAYLQTVIVPSLARIRSASVLKRRLVQLALACLAFAFAVVALGMLFAGQILWLLGPNYSHLGAELVLILFCGALTVMDAALHGFNIARGWVKWYWTMIPVLIVFQGLLVLILDVSTVFNAILIRTVGLLPGIAFSLLIASYSLRHHRDADSEPILKKVEPRPELVA